MSGHGGGRFWNFYQENWDSQGPLYRHLLVTGTDSPWSCCKIATLSRSPCTAVRLANLKSITTADHCNTEHSQGEANLEIAGTTAAIKVHGFKAEGNYVQICKLHDHHVQSRHR